MTSSKGKFLGALLRSSPEPLYRQLAAQFAEAIRNGALKQGDKLESEELLTKRFQVSRITVRQAIDELVRKQVVVRKQGKGTFVTVPPVRHDLRRTHGLFNSLFSQAQNASAKLMRYELAAPPVEVASAMGLRPGEPALALDRLYLIGGKPIGLAQDWLDPSIAALPRAKAETISTEEMMLGAGIHIAQSQVSIRAETAGALPAKLLKISRRAPVLVHRRYCFGTDGKAKEVARIWICSDRYEFVCSTRKDGPMEAIFDVRNVEERIVRMSAAR
jgi:GntR family transcriptional regulator